MYFASLLFCWVAINGPQCLVAEDTYGPYPTDKLCHARIERWQTKSEKKCLLQISKGGSVKT